MPGDDPAFKTFKVPGIDILVSETQGGLGENRDSIVFGFKKHEGGKGKSSLPPPLVLCAFERLELP